MNTVKEVNYSIKSDDCKGDDTWTTVRVMTIALPLIGYLDSIATQASPLDSMFYFFWTS